MAAPGIRQGHASVCQCCIFPGWEMVTPAVRGSHEHVGHEIQRTETGSKGGLAKCPCLTAKDGGARPGTGPDRPLFNNRGS